MREIRTEWKYVDNVKLREEEEKEGKRKEKRKEEEDEDIEKIERGKERGESAPAPQS
jgi:hypothetical protein